MATKQQPGQHIDLEHSHMHFSLVCRLQMMQQNTAEYIIFLCRLLTVHKVMFAAYE